MDPENQENQDQQLNQEKKMVSRSRNVESFTADAIVGEIQRTLEGAATDFLSQLGGLISQYETRLTALATNRSAFEKARVANTTPLVVVLSSSEAATLEEEERTRQEQQQKEKKDAEENTVSSSGGKPTGATTAGAAEEQTASTTTIPDDDDDKPDYIVRLSFDSNSLLLREVEWLRLEAGKLARQLDRVSDWMALNMPSMNEENSAATEILAAVLEQVQSLVETVRSIVGLPKKYLSDRGDVEKELLKLPESRAIQMQLELVDAEMWEELEKSWKALIRVTLIAHSVITKNKETLWNPLKSVKTAESTVYY